jgi:hypothetical protein
VPVVAARKADDQVAAGEAPGQADGAHRRLGPRADQAHLVDRRHCVDDLFREPDFALRRRAERRPVERSLPDGLDHLRVRVPEDERSPRLHPVDVALPFGVFDVSTLAPADEERLAPDDFPRANGRIDAPRNGRLGPLP